MLPKREKLSQTKRSEETEAEALLGAHHFAVGDLEQDVGWDGRKQTRPSNLSSVGNANVAERRSCGLSIEYPAGIRDQAGGHPQTSHCAVACFLCSESSSDHHIPSLCACHGTGVTDGGEGGRDGSFVGATRSQPGSVTATERKRQQRREQPEPTKKMGELERETLWSTSVDRTTTVPAEICAAEDGWI